jgi:hypothetical protein
MDVLQLGDLQCTARQALSTHGPGTAVVISMNETAALGMEVFRAMRPASICWWMYEVRSINALARELNKV